MQGHITYHRAMKNDTATYVVVDFECLQPYVWQSLGIIVVQNHACIQTLELSCDRGDTVHDKTRVFWTTHADAFTYNVNNGKGHDVDTQERRICEFVAALKRDMPCFRLLSDTPAYDIALLDDILRRHGHEPMCDRGNGRYFQAICTWSSRKVLRLMGVNIVETCTWLTVPTHTLPHTPVYDCIDIYNQYMNVLETMYTQRTYNMPWRRKGARR